MSQYCTHTITTEILTIHSFPVEKIMAEYATLCTGVLRLLQYFYLSLSALILLFGLHKEHTISTCQLS